MKTALINYFGSPDVVTIGDAVPRELKPYEASVRVEIAGVNPLDVKIIAGYLQQVFPITFPYAPGTDFSGVIDAVGTEVKNQVKSLKRGDRVVGRTAPGEGGAIAKSLMIAATDLFVIPAEMSF